MSDQPTKRGHWPAGKPRNPAPRYTLKLISELAKFLAATKGSSGVANPYSVKACGAATGVSTGSIKYYISGRYVPSPEIVAKLAAWLKHARACARRENLI